MFVIAVFCDCALGPCHHFTGQMTYLHLHVAVLQVALQQMQCAEITLHHITDTVLPEMDH